MNGAAGPTGQLCSKHQGDLADALRKKGLWSMCKTDASSVAMAAEQWLKGTGTCEEFNPLVACLLEIKGKAAQFGHPELARTCPLCGVERRHQLTGMAASWIDNVTDSMLLLAKSNGIVR